MSQQTLRAQDSIPFFRRISSEYRRPQFDQQDSPASDTLPELDRSVSSPCHSSLMTEDVSERDSVQDNVTVVDALECRSQGTNGSMGNLPIPDLDAITSEMLRQGKDVTTPLVGSPDGHAYVSGIALSHLLVLSDTIHYSPFLKSYPCTRKHFNHLYRQGLDRATLSSRLPSANVSHVCRASRIIPTDLAIYSYRM